MRLLKVLVGVGLGISEYQLGLPDIARLGELTRARAVRPYTTPPETTAMI